MRTRHMLVVTAIVLIALSGCVSSEKAGSGEQAGGSGGKVATLTSAAAPPSASSSKVQRPRERLDTTDEELQAMLGPYNKCIKEHGGLAMKGGSGSGLARPATTTELDKADEANRICEPQYYPLPPWEKDPANPESRDFARNVVKCLKAEGVKYVEVAEDGISLALGGEQNHSRSISMGLDLAPECERKVAAGRR